MHKAVQILTTPSGERLAVLPERDYLMLLAASVDERGEIKPESLVKVRSRGDNAAQAGRSAKLKKIKRKKG